MSKTRLEAVLPKGTNGGYPQFEDLPPDQRDEAILTHEFPRIVNDIVALTGRGVRLIWDPLTQTASTDCIAKVYLAPWFFLKGLRAVGYGTSYHEAGHIVFSPRGGELMKQSHQQGGDTRRHIMNILLDRKDDMLNADASPGFAPLLRARLAYICTMAYRTVLEKRGLDVSNEEAIALLKNWKPAGPWEDFFNAAKWHKRPRTREVARVMKYLRRDRLCKASDAELLWMAEKIHEKIGEPPEQEQSDGGEDLGTFLMLVAVAAGIEMGIEGGEIDAELAKLLAKVAGQHVSNVRAKGLQQLVRLLKQQGMVHPGPLSVGKHDSVPVEKVRPGPQFAARYAELKAEADAHVSKLLREMRRLDSPRHITLRGRDRGRLDTRAVAKIAVGLPGFRKETITERDIDAHIGLAIDCSGSVAGAKLGKLKRIATVFSEAILSNTRALDGHVWGYNSDKIWDFGPVSRQSGFVELKGGAGNSDTHMLRIAGETLARSRRRRRLLLVLTDDGPDSVEDAGKMARQLMSKGIIVIHCLVGVHGVPDIYPVELIFSDMEELLGEFGNVIVTALRNMR